MKMFLRLTICFFKCGNVVWMGMATTIGCQKLGSLARNLVRSLARSLARSLVRSLARSLVRSLARNLVRSLAGSLARSLARRLARSPIEGSAMAGRAYPPPFPPDPPLVLVIVCNSSRICF